MQTAELSYSRRQNQSVRLWLELCRSAGALESLMDTRFREVYGQSMSRFDVLSQLERATGHRLPIGELGQKLLASKGNITGLLTRMENEGLVRRQPSSTDRRSVGVIATKKGVTLFRDMAFDHAAWAEGALRGLSVKDMESLISLLGKTRLSMGDNVP